MAVIDLSNYQTTLAQSTSGRIGNINGNVFFDTAGKIEYLSATEQPFINLTNAGTPQGTADVLATANVDTTYYMIKTIGTTDFTLFGAASNAVGLVFQSTATTGVGTGTMDECTANPLLESDGIKFEGSYAFENQERKADENLREFDRWTSGTFKFGGAYNYINGRVPATAVDVAIHRGSGWNEIDGAGVVQKIYFGNKGLSNIGVASQPYFMLSNLASPVLNDIIPVDFAKAGQIDEAVLVYENGVSDTRAYEGVSVRTFTNNFDRKDTVNDLGIAELGGYSTGFAVNESEHLTTKNYTLADVYGGAKIAPWTTMSLEKLAVAQVETGFNEADGNFTWVLNNTAGGSLDECVAFLDALAQTDDDIDSGAITVTHGKRVGTWYYYNATGQVVTRSGADSLGLFIEEVPTADEQNVVFTDDAEGLKTRPFSVSIDANIGATAKADVNAWYHAFFAAAYNTSGAITVVDSSAVAIKGLASESDGSNIISDAFDYDGDTVGGGAGTDKDCVYLCEGDGGATQAKTLFTITRQTTVSFTCAPGVENNV